MQAENQKWRLRDEQKQAIRQTKLYLQRCRKNRELEPQYLWNAKPRFGKTVTAYSFARAMSARRVIIVTNRPAIASAWYDDFCKFGFQDRGQNDSEQRWIFTSSASVKRQLGRPENVFTRKEQLAHPVLMQKDFVYFISLQDIKGRKADQFKRRNQWIFELSWDLMIIDESHEAVDTAQASEVFKRVKRKFALHLSGTPFKAMANGKFADEQIFNWTYPDEQVAKAAWVGDDNPYIDLPQMQIITYRLQQALGLTTEKIKLEDCQYAFDLSELLRVAKIGGADRFVYEDQVKTLVESLSKAKYPFANPELRHTFWLLPGVKACEQLKKLLLEDEYFSRNYQPENIIVAAGIGDRQNTTPLEEVKNRIAGSGKARTITLSCGQLTTGVTIPEWQAVIMLCNCQSPALYMQTAFRAQSPYRNKSQCYVYDFAAENVLRILAELATSGDQKLANIERELKIKSLIDCMPVLAEDKNGDLCKLEANEILSIPVATVTEEILNRGFMSNRLFQNISGVFGGPKEIQKILAKLDSAKAAGENGKRRVVELEGLSSENKASQKAFEQLVRDQLRGFVRTIPSFLMAYGDDETRLGNLEQKVPDHVFAELTNITKDEFRKLRDGVDVVRTKNGKTTKQHFEGLFNTEVFNLAIQAFLRKRDDLAYYYLAEANTDIFDYIPLQVNHQVFTPRKVVRAMLDKLESLDPQIFKSTENRFFDPYMKSGLFITEVVRRIFQNTRELYESDFKCVKHILENQVYGLAPTPILMRITENFIFGFDWERKISRKNFQEYDICDETRRGTTRKIIPEIFNLGDEMKFAAVIGNPPYQHTISKTTRQTQSNSNWIYQHFQRAADERGERTCMIYPFGGWFDAPESLGGLGQQILTDGHTVSIEAYEASADRRTWYRSDRDPEPIFGASVNLSAGVAIVLRDLTKSHAEFTYTNRIYTDVGENVKISEANSLPPNPAFWKISRKLGPDKLVRRMRKDLFGIESKFVEQNPDKVSAQAEDWKNPIRLLTNNRSGSAGRTQLYWTDKKYLPRGEEYFELTKIIMPAAYPKKSLMAGEMSIDDVRQRITNLVQILPANSAFGASRMALFMSRNPRECENFLKYTQTKFFAALLLQEPNRRSSLGEVIPDQDFSENAEIDWSLTIDEIDRQLYKKYKLTAEDLKFLGIG